MGKKTQRQQPSLLLNPHVFAASTALALNLLEWPLRWLVSGAPVLTYSILLGAAKGYRIFPFVPLWTLLATLHLAYAVAATSWLLYWFFAVGCYFTILISCLFQFDAAANLARRTLRSLLHQLQFVNDKIAIFDLPALEIDTEVNGLMVIRGVTLSLSSLSIVAHGVEVGIKLSDDIELAIQTDEVVIQLFRRIDVGDVYASIKGGEFEMTFGKLEESTEDADGESLMDMDTPLLRAAATFGSTSSFEKVSMKRRMTTGGLPKSASAKDGLKSMTTMSPGDTRANEKYKDTLAFIAKTSLISESRRTIKKYIRKLPDTNGRTFNHAEESDMRATICSQLHEKPSVPHPPRRSVKVTTLQNLSSPRMKRFMHRLPMLLRALLNPVSYFHPVRIASITAAGSGQWVKYMLQTEVFKHYAAHDAEIRRLEQRVYSWLADANFVAQLVDITGTAHVPLVTRFDILCQLAIDDVMVYRTLPKVVDLKQVTRLGGADASLTIPIFLLPHHEHLLPSVPTREDERKQEKCAENANGLPNTVQAQAGLEQLRKDETNVKIAAHASLPACFDQELLGFVAALVKATKVIEMEKDSDATDQEIRGFKDSTKALHNKMKDGMKRAAVDAMANDRWIAKLVHKVTRMLEKAQGNVGYVGNIPVKLDYYRAIAEPDSKILA